jgi:hypothetical protein
MAFQAVDPLSLVQNLLLIQAVACWRHCWVLAAVLFCLLKSLLTQTLIDVLAAIAWL